LLKGVVKGIADYGNCMGIPTVAGEIYFDDSYEGNPLVNAFVVGIVNKKDIMRGTLNDALIEKSYDQYIVNRALSYFADTIFFVNEMNTKVESFSKEPVTDSIVEEVANPAVIKKSKAAKYFS